MDEVGPTFLANQDKLADYVTWIQKDDRYYDAGYVGAVADSDHLQLTLLWKGVSPLQGEALAEGARRGVTALLESRPYSLDDRAHLQDLLEKSDDVLRALGFVATGLDGIRAENTPLTVRGHVAANALATFSLDAATQLVSRITGVPTRVRVEDDADIPLGETTSEVDPSTGARLTGTATRDTDTVQFNSGGLMARGGLRCTNGFTIRYNSINYTTTARHCDRDDWHAYSTSQDYGTIVKKSSASGGNADILAGRGWYRMFDGAAYQPDGYYKNVRDWKDYSINMSVCDSGGMSGVHCGLKIIETSNSVLADDGSSHYLTFKTEKTSSLTAIAASTGDSGGPVFVPISGTEEVYATGMIQVGSKTVSCSGTRDSTPTCTHYMNYTTIHTILNNWGATLVTQ